MTSTRKPSSQKALVGLAQTTAGDTTTSNTPDLGNSTATARPHHNNNATSNSEILSDIDNYFTDNEGEGEDIQYYDTAFPSLLNRAVGSAATVSTSGSDQQKAFPFSNDLSQLSIVKVDPATRPLSSTTETFVIPLEERRFVEESSSTPAAATATPAAGLGDSNAGAAHLRKLLQEVCANNAVRLETNVALRDQSMRVFITGTKQNLLEAKRKIMRILQTQQEITMEVDKEYHGVIIGSKGNQLRDIEIETSTQINVPRPKQNSNSITIRGSRDCVEHARQTVQRLVDEAAKVGRAVVPIDKCYHQLVCHRSNASLHVVLTRKQLRLDVPPASVNRAEIAIAGDREGVQQAASILRQTYETMKASFQELQIEIPREKHRFIIGSRGSGLKDILDRTGVWVQIAPTTAGSGGQTASGTAGTDSSSNTVTLLGPKDSLGSALTEIFTKTESVHLASVPAPGWLHKFIIGRQGARLTELTANKPSINLSFERDSDSIGVEGPPEEVEQVVVELTAKVAELESQLSRLELPIDAGMVKHLIGSGGANVQKIRQESGCSLSFGSMAADSFVIIIGPPEKVTQAKETLLKTIDIIENTKKKDVMFSHELIPQLVGQNGRSLKDTKSAYPDVRLILPPPDSGSDVISLIGPREQVDQFALLIQKKHKELVECNYSKKVIVPHKYHRVIIGREGLIIREITKATNTKFSIPGPAEEKDEITITGRREDVEKAEQRVLNIYHKEHNIIEVSIEIPKPLHTILIGKGGSRVNALKDECGGSVTVRFPAPDTESNTVVVKGTKEEVAQAQAALHRRVEEVTASNYEHTFAPAQAEHLLYLSMVPETKLRSLREKYHIRAIEAADKCSIKLVGQNEDVLAVVEFLETSVKTMGAIVTESLELPAEHVGYFQNSDELIRIGRNHHCQLTVPKSTDAKRTVTKGHIECRGPSSHVRAAKEELLSIVDDYENSTTDSLLIDSKQFANLKKFSNKQLDEIVYKYKLQLQIVPDSPELQTQLSLNSIDHPLVNGLDSSFSEEESIKSHSPHSHNLPNGFPPDSAPNSSPVPAAATGSAAAGVGDHGLLSSEISSTVSSGIHIHNDSVSHSKFPKLRILLTGRREKLPLAKEDIIKLLVIDLEVDVPEEMYPVLIGSKGSKIREMRERYNVNILIPTRPNPDHSGASSSGHFATNKMVVVSGPSERAVEAKREIIDIVEQLRLQKEERELKNNRLVVEADRRHHRAIIGQKGDNINKWRVKHEVRIIVPSSDSSSNEIVLLGHRDNVQLARDDILHFIHKLESSVIEDLVIDSRIHSRLIGSRGANLDKLKKKFHVEVVFPARGTEGQEADIVKVKGTKEGVDQCADELISRANELLEEIEDSPPRQFEGSVSNKFNSSNNNPSRPKPAQSAPGSRYVDSRPTPSSGFQVRNAPWQQPQLLPQGQSWADAVDDDEEGEVEKKSVVERPGGDAAVANGRSLSKSTPVQTKWSQILGANK